MSLNVRFAIVSDPHIALPHTIWDHASRFHLVEVSIPAMESVLTHLEQLNLDFLLLPGDLTQHGEADNHVWLAERLRQLSFPAYVIPGNHDVIHRQATAPTIGLQDFPRYYRKFGYDNTERPYYTQVILPDLRLIGLNSIQFDAVGVQHRRGSVDDEQLAWLEQVLATATEELLIVMIHHNVIEHLPGQARHRLGQRYLLENQAALLQRLRAGGITLVFTGHLHVQDIAFHDGVYDITTGSLVSYPHPYRVLTVHTDPAGNRWLQVESYRVESIPGWPTLQQTSRQWMGDRSFPFLQKLLSEPHLGLSPTDIQALSGDLQYFWANLAQGDAIFSFPQFPPAARRYFEAFSATHPEGYPRCIDNHIGLLL